MINFNLPGRKDSEMQLRRSHKLYGLFHNEAQIKVWAFLFILENILKTLFVG